MVHREEIERYSGTLVELASELGDLRYDALAMFLRALSEKLEQDAAADLDRGRIKLSSALQESAASVKSAACEIERAWSICVRYM